MVFINKSNKKGIVFWPGLLIFVGILFLIFVSFLVVGKKEPVDYIGKYSSDIFTYSYKEQMLTDYSYSIEKNFNNNKLPFAKEGMLNLDSNFFISLSSQNIDTSNMIGGNCEHNNNYLWFNKKEQYDCSDIITPEYLKTLFEYYFKQKDKTITQEIIPLHLTSNLNCIFDISGLGNCDLTLQHSINNLYSKSFQQKIPIDYKEYFTLILGVKNNFEKVYEENKEKIADCIFDKRAAKDQKKAINKCYTDNYQDLIKINNLKSTDYAVNITQELIPGTTTDYMLLTFSILKNNEEVFLFSGLFEENIPPQPLAFFLKNKENENKIVKLNINNPLVPDNIEQYVVIMSHTDFKNNADLEKVLFSNKLPNKITLNNCDTSSINMPIDSGASYKYFKEHDVTILTINQNSPLLTKTQGIDYLKIIELKGLCQNTLNTAGNTFSIVEFEENPLFVFVYAIDKNNNFYKQKLVDTTLQITPQNLKGPLPLPFVIDSDKSKLATLYSSSTIPKIELTSTYTLIEKSIRVKISDYTNTNFNFYDIYISEGDNLNIQTCKSQPPINCFKYTLPTTNPNADIIITSDEDLLHSTMSIPAELQNSIKINSQSFSPYFQLKNNQKYSIILVPKNSQNIGTFDTLFKVNGIDYMMKSKNIKTTNSKPPHPINSIVTNSPKIEQRPNTFVLEYTKSTGYDISGFIIDGHIEFKDGRAIETFQDDKVTNLGVISSSIMDNYINNYVDVSKIVITKILPYGIGGYNDNYDDKNLIHSGQYHQAIWINPN